VKEILLNPVVLSVLSVIPLVLGVTALALLVRWVFREKQGYPREAEVEAALRPYVYRAIMLAYKTSERLVDQNMDRLRGLDKKALADWAYNALPENIYIRGFPIPIGVLKKLISQESFAAMVQGIFDDFETWYASVYANWGREIEQLLDEIDS